MKQKQYILHSWTIEIIAVVLASMIAFQVCNIFGIRMSLLPFIMATGYVILKLMYHLCIIVARYVIEAIPPSFWVSVKKRSSKKTLALASFPISNSEEVQKKRMELFHYEYQREQQQYQQQKEKEDDEKLNAVLKYTRVINSGGESHGASDLRDAVITAVVNKRAGGMGLISGRKAFQKPMNKGVELLNAIQDVYLDPAITIA